MANERAARNQWQETLAIYRSAREVTVTSCARPKARYGETMDLGRVAMASAMGKVTLCVDRIVLVSSLGFFETAR